MKMQMREADNSSYNCVIHENDFMDNTTASGSDRLRIPKLQITAIA